jgi:hypothetical protein
VGYGGREMKIVVVFLILVIWGICLFRLEKRVTSIETYNYSYRTANNKNWDDLIDILEERR